MINHRNDKKYQSTESANTTLIKVLWQKKKSHTDEDYNNPHKPY